MLPWICTVGHVATTRDLVARGATARQLADAVRTARLTRLKPGTYACPHLDPEVARAARSGVLLDCVTVLDRLEDQWSGVNSAGLHYRARPGTHLAGLPPDAILHWSPHPPGSNRGAEVPVAHALLQATRCLPPLDWLASVESALHLGNLDEHGLEWLRVRIPGRLRSTLLRLDRGAGSGLETFTRELIRDAGHVVETQVWVPGVGRLDLLVDSLVGVETDGVKWHLDRFTADRTKDIGVRLWGVPTLRIGSHHIFEMWDETLATIEIMLADARLAPRGGLRMHRF